jgi:uroporphyrinogen-III synthase
MRPLLLLRPEPGLSRSAEQALSMGLKVLTCPLFRIVPVGWDVPEAHDYDALLLTSANAVRRAGPGLELLRQLPVHAVGRATARAAEAAGLKVQTVGDGGAVELLGDIPASERLLHLAGEHRRALSGPQSIDTRVVYQAAAIEAPRLPPLDGLVVAVHSPRAAHRLGEIAARRERTAIAAISQAAADSCGPGWEQVNIAARPDDSSLLALAASLCHTSPPA